MAQTPQPKTGLYQTITNTTDSDVIAAPAGARGFTVWFVDTDGNFVEGRVAVLDSDTPLTGVDNHDMGWHGPMPYYYDLNRYPGTLRTDDVYIHLACDTAGAVAKGSFYY